MLPAGLSHILVIDDDAGACVNLHDILELDDYSVESAGTAAAALDRHDWEKYFAIILDRKLPDSSAEILLPMLMQLAPNAAVLIVTGFADLDGAIAALRQGAADYILKPISPEALRASLLRIRERHRLTLEKERSEAAFRTLIEAAPCMIVILRPDHGIVYFSPFAEEITAYRSNDVLGRNFFDVLLASEFRQSVLESVQGVLNGRPIRSAESPVLCKDGSARWLVWNAQRLPDYEGSEAVLMVGQDITTLKQAQERNLQAERLAAIGQMVTGLAHESGNALARSQVCLEMLAMEVQDRGEALDLVARIQMAQDHLQHLYEEVRTYAAPLRLQRERQPLFSIWRQAWTNLALHREGRQASFREEVNGFDVSCEVDPFRLEQVFRNMMENSLAACQDPTQVTISASATSLEGKPAIRLALRDNGPGLTAEQQQRIFEPFFTTKTKGTGLGMAIAKRIVEAHGGRISLGSSSGQGAEIVITLPRDSR
jgi:two-component system, LuxR family, sensor kinase FixL